MLKTSKNANAHFEQSSPLSSRHQFVHFAVFLTFLYFYFITLQFYYVLRMALTGHPASPYPSACGAPQFSIFPKSGSGATDYDCVLPIGVLYHCLAVSTAEQCIRAYNGGLPYMSLQAATSSLLDGGLAAPASTPAIQSPVEEWIRTAAYVVQVVSPTLLALGLLSNLLVMVVLCHVRMRSGINSFLLSATIAQILYIISVFLLRLVDYSKDYAANIFHDQGRVYIHHLSYFFWLILVWQLLCGGIERILTGFSPDSAKRQCSPLRADAVNILVWLCAFGLVFPVLWYGKLEMLLGYAVSKNHLACSVLYWFQLVFSIFIPYPSFLILIVMLIASLVKQVSSMRKITLGSNGELWRLKVEEDVQLTRLVLVQMIFFFLLTGAYAIGQLVLTLNLAPDNTPCMWSMLIDLFHLGPLLYSALQFILFGCILEKFATTFRRMCCRCCGKE
ncbi:hypothetical protein BV898_00005 [Hypsibius exemplaris]|uniref:G-protein coupled receptors family 1 profile domain-containing protein n=1 Tax=Hypsibius exemplaris TaxID=2072580 RepID=A0A1W0XEF6_HYPEX|nr:hypothetical protein BV898_00005 [Hypsibius exemplaris]